VLDDCDQNDGRPAVVGVVCDRRTEDGVVLDTLRVRYLEALRNIAKVVPLAIPSGLSANEINACLSRLDGVLLTGAASNVAPSLYGEADVLSNTLDPERDRTTSAVIALALRQDIPLFGICRGLQELNVALGGTLTNDISCGADRQRHTEDLSLPRDLQYAVRQEIRAEGDGIIARCIRQIGENPVLVNSLHQQGIARLATDLAVDARCVDGVIEAVSLRHAKTFTAAVQWHPEWHCSTDPLSRQIFQEFGEACRRHQEA